MATHSRGAGEYRSGQPPTRCSGSHRQAPDQHALECYAPRKVAFDADDGSKSMRNSDKHRGAARSILPDHMKHRINEAIVVHARDYQNRPAFVDHRSRRQMTRNKAAKRHTKRGDHFDRRERVINARRRHEYCPFSPQRAARKR